MKKIEFLDRKKTVGLPNGVLFKLGDSHYVIAEGDIVYKVVIQSGICEDVFTCDSNDTKIKELISKFKDQLKQFR